VASASADAANSTPADVPAKTTPPDEASKATAADASTKAARAHDGSKATQVNVPAKAARADAPAKATPPDAPGGARPTYAPGSDRPADAAGRDPNEAAARAGVEGGSETERRAIARRLHRVLVDHQYGVARDAWAEAVPDLRAAWENHKERYPERLRPTPETTADGTWMAGPHRRLSPEQNAEASKACADIADEGRRDILPALKRVESAEPGRDLVGLNHMLKGEDRLKEKVAERLEAKPGRTIQQAISAISDPVRFTFCYNPPRYADGVRADVDRLKTEGFELIKLKNLWADEQYKGINSQWRRPETGLRMEVQFHTPESLEAKELTHEAYERIRSPVRSAERQELEAFQRQANAFLITPEGTEEIDDYPEKRNDRKDQILCDS
jgi:hypothetical protein